MRVDLESRLRPLQKLQLKLIKMIARLPEPPGPMLVCSYRRRMFGKLFSAVLQEAMRDATHWSDGELELFAAFVSRKNQCPF